MNCFEWNELVLEQNKKQQAVKLSGQDEELVETISGMRFNITTRTAKDWRTLQRVTPWHCLGIAAYMHFHRASLTWYIIRRKLCNWYRHLVCYDMNWKFWYIQDFTGQYSILGYICRDRVSGQDEGLVETTVVKPWARFCMVLPGMVLFALGCDGTWNLLILHKMKPSRPISRPFAVKI